MRALLCFHGLLSTKADFNTILPKLNTLYDTIACYDLPGHGYNTLKFNTLNIKKFVLENGVAYRLRRFLRAFINNIPNI